MTNNGCMSSPYEACQSVVIVEQEKFNANSDIKKKLFQALFVKKVASGASVLVAGSSVYYYEKAKD